MNQTNFNSIPEGARFDAAIIGAGPAGAVAAAILAGRGWRVLLAEKSSWPRAKVCGGCLNAVAVRALRDAGLSAVLRGAAPLDRAIWHADKKSIAVTAKGGAAILRSELDFGLVEAAKARGVVFVSDTAAVLAESHENNRLLLLRCGNGVTTINAGVVLACDGLGGTSLSKQPWADWRYARRSWMGVSVTQPLAAGAVPAGAVSMFAGAGGYVGFAPLPDRRVHLAAALDPAESQRCGGPGELIEQILHDAGGPTLTGLSETRWNGIGRITRWRRQLGSHRVLAVGDACGYFEPCTGEGIGWAISGASAVVNLLPDPGAPWPATLPDAWRRAHLDMLRRGSMWRAALGAALRYPALSSISIRAARGFPQLANIASRSFTAGEFA